VRAITVSAGEAHPDIFAERLVDLLAQIDHTDIPIGAGSPDPLQGDNAFPDSWRSSSDNFWDVRLEPAQSDVRVAPAAELMVEILSASEEPVALFVSGTHTNLAEALRLDPGIREHISGVFIMGGSVYAPGNVGSESSAIPNETAEWNIYVDPLAASEVFASGLELHLVPLDATNQVQWSAADTQTWGTSDSPISALAVQVMQNSLGRWSPGGTNIWDLVTAVTASDPSLCKETHLPLEIVLEKGPDEGQTRLTEGTPNVYVCLEPDAEQIKARAAQVFGQ
jgi:purine nucleosidase/pyrimidine-specific ribonucleoside hydrolase